MTLSYRLDPDAEQELAEAMAWYDAERAGLGLDLLDEVHAVAQRAAEFPESGEIIRGLPLQHEFRRFLLKIFPYALIARVQPGELAILVVAHQHRKPRYWRKRIAKISP